MTIITKQTKHMGELVFKEISKEESKPLIIKNHYSHKWGSAFGVINVGVFRDNRLLGVAVFGHMMNPNSFNKIADIEKNQIIELNRLWIDDELGHNAETITLGASWKILKRDYPHIKLVQSFADGRLGVGTIYKAANFKYYGKSTARFYENQITGEIKHGALYDDGRHPKAMIKHSYDILNNEIQQLKVNSYRYIYKLDKKVNIKLKEKEYPKYSKGFKLSEPRWSENHYAKLYVLHQALGHTMESEILYDRMSGTDSEKQMRINEARKHEHIKKYLEELK